MHSDRLGGHRADIFTGAATAAALRIDSDADPRYQPDGIGITALHAGETAAVFGQTGIIMGNSLLVVPWCRDEIRDIRHLRS